MSTHTDIIAALRTHLLAVSGLPAARQLENRTFKPVTGTPWVRESLRPISAELASFGNGGLVQERGQYLVDVFYPANTGTRDAFGMADAIVAAFRPGIALTYGGATVRVQRAERAAGQSEPDWFMVPVAVTYFLHRPNQ